MSEAAIDSRTAGGRIFSPRLDGITFGDYLDQRAQLPNKPEVLSIFPVKGDADYLVREALKRDLGGVVKLRLLGSRLSKHHCYFAVLCHGR